MSERNNDDLPDEEAQVDFRKLVADLEERPHEVEVDVDLGLKGDPLKAMNTIGAKLHEIAWDATDGLYDFFVSGLDVSLLDPEDNTTVRSVAPEHPTSVEWDHQITEFDFSVSVGVLARVGSDWMEISLDEDDVHGLIVPLISALHTLGVGSARTVAVMGGPDQLAEEPGEFRMMETMMDWDELGMEARTNLGLDAGSVLDGETLLGLFSVLSGSLHQMMLDSEEPAPSWAMYMVDEMMVDTFNQLGQQAFEHFQDEVLEQLDGLSQSATGEVGILGFGQIVDRAVPGIVQTVIPIFIELDDGVPSFSLGQQYELGVTSSVQDPGTVASIQLDQWNLGEVVSIRLLLPDGMVSRSWTVPKEDYETPAFENVGEQMDHRYAVIEEYFNQTIEDVARAH